MFCDESKLDEKGTISTPDFLVEILSPSTEKKDLNIKLLLYQKHRVKEYWIVDPINESISIYLLDEDGKYPEVQIFIGLNTSIQSKILEEFEINLKEVFS